MSGYGPKHKCAATGAGCNAEVPTEMLMCWKHWRMLPRGMQLEIFRTAKLIERSEYRVLVAQAIRLVTEKENEKLPLFEKHA